MLSKQQRAGIINELVTNCDMWRGYGDRELLETFPDDKLVALRDMAQSSQQAVDVANAAVSGFTDGGTAYRVNPETGQWEKRVVGNAGRGCDEEDDMGEEESDEDEDDGYVERTNRRRMTGNRGTGAPGARRFQTQDEMLRSLPPQLQETLRVAQEIEQREKDSLINQILVNSAIPDTDKQAHYERLQTRSVDELRNDLALLPKLPKPDELDRVTRNRGGIRTPARGDMLGVPEIDWETGEPVGLAANAEDGDEGGGGYFPSGVDLSGSVSDEEEFLRMAPPRMRATIQNAMAIEGREKQKIIDQLVANAPDEDTARRLAQRFRSKSLEELHELLAITPTSAGYRRPNYFASAGGPTSNYRGANNSGDDGDVLLPPTVDWAASE